jgi:hypothetical protein
LGGENAAAEIVNEKHGKETEKSTSSVRKRVGLIDRQDVSCQEQRYFSLIIRLASHSPFRENSCTVRYVPRDAVLCGTLVVVVVVKAEIPTAMPTNAHAARKWNTAGAKENFIAAAAINDIRIKQFGTLFGPWLFSVAIYYVLANRSQFVFV